MARVNRVAIIGLGLIGGSLGMALRRRRLAKTIVGYSRKPSTLRRAKQARAIDVGTTNLRAAVRDADLIVLATPVDAIVPFAKQVARYCRRGAILTDVGSTKVRIVRQLERSLPAYASFVGGHPIAGSERRGIEAASADLFTGALYVVTPTPQTHRGALPKVIRFWKPLVKKVITMSPQNHDRLFAATSHLPHLVAACLAGAIPAQALSSAAPSFLEMTRLAKSDPELWDDIFLSNRREVIRALDRFHRQCHVLRKLLTGSRRAELRRFLANAKAKRDALHDS